MSFKPKLIALDCDGTLLDSKSRLTERTKKTLQEAIRQGIYVVIATGRMYPSALPLINEIGTTAPCVFYNGALVRSPLTGETYYHRGLGRGLTAELVDFYLGHGWYIQTYCDDKLYVYDDSDERCKMYEGIAGVKAIPLGA
jgi:HAD superfamily hydrolase (TIGR01484 family)